MAYIPPIKRYTKRQIADGCAVDALKLDAALQDVLDTHNNLNPGDIRTRYVRQQYVWGWEPPKNDMLAVAAEDRIATKLPFSHINNNAVETVNNVGFNTYALNGRNAWRQKGCNVTIVDPAIVVGSTHGTSQYSWTNMIQTRAPTILDGVHLMLAADRTYYDNTFFFPNPPGAGLKSPAQKVSTAGSTDWVDDIVLQVQCSSPLGANNARLSTLEFNVWGIRAESLRILNYTAGASDFAPASITGFPDDGVALWFDGLDIPIPEDSRVRLSLILPYYDPLIWDTPWGETPWQEQTFHLTATMLEMLR